MSHDKPGARRATPHRFSGLRTQLFAIAVVALAPAALLTVYMAVQEYRDMRADVQADALRLVRMVATDHEKRVAVAHRLLLATALAAEFRAAQGARCPPALGQVLGQSLAAATTFNNLALIDHRGVRLCAWPDDHQPVPPSDVVLARQAIETRQLAVGGYRLEANNGKAEMHLAYPVATPPGRPPAALVLSLDLAYLGEMLRHSGLPDAAVIAVWSESGKLLYRYPEPEKWVGKDIAHTPPAQRILGQTSEGVTEAVGLDGVPRLIAYTPLRLINTNEKVYVHIGIPTEVAYAGVVRKLALALAGLILAIIVMLALAAWGANTLIVRPVAALVAAARRFGAGNFRARCAVAHSTGEIGALATAFNDMAQKIEERHFELENLKFALDEHAIVSVTDPAGNIIYVNDKFCETSGYAREDLIGQNHRVIKSDHHPKSFFTELWRTIGGGFVWRGDICIRRKDGALHWLASTIVPITGPGGELLRYIAIRTDITPLKEVEETLHRSEAKFRSLADTVSAATIVHRGGKLLYANRYAERLTGYSGEELRNMDFDEFAHPDWRPALREIWAARQHGEAVPARYEYRGNTKNGEVRWVEVSGCLMEYEGLPSALITAIDVTERKNAEDALRQAHHELEALVARRTEQLGQAQEQLVQSDKLASIGQLAAGVAHEINNPIGFVQSNLGSLERYLHDLFDMVGAYESVEAALATAAPQTADALRQRREALDIDFIKEDIPKLLHESKEGITRVRKIVQDLKDFSRVDKILEWEFADLHKCLDSTLNIAANEIKYKADVVKAYGELPEVECLPSQLNQVFMNLLVNAAQAMDGPRGSITVRTGATDDGVWIEIADTGKGIPAENLKRIFDPFFTTKPVGQGTGLGLSLSYGIVRKHYGDIAAHSEIGQGTTFRITLPLRQADK